MGAVAAAFEHYLASLVGSWRALAAARPGATVTEQPGYAAARFPEPVFNNAVVLDAAAVPAAEAAYAGAGGYALWCRDDDRETAAALAGRGYRITEVTRPMHCSLADLGDPGESTTSPVAVGDPGGAPAATATVLTDADPERVAELNGVPGHLLRGVPGLRAYATGDYRCGLVLQPVGTDVYVSFVATLPAARGRGLATAVTRAALLDARARGAHTATLQASAMAERLYTRLGFRPVARWHEWSPAA